MKSLAEELAEKYSLPCGAYTMMPVAEITLDGAIAAIDEALERAAEVCSESHNYVRGVFSEIECGCGKQLAENIRGLKSK